MPQSHESPKFSESALTEYRDLLGRYPTRQAALLPTLWIAQREFGWLSDATQDYVAHLMELPPAHVRAVVSFYTMFNRKPVGRYLLDVCTNLSCRLGETTPDGRFTLGSVECLASCGTAPMLQLNQDAFIENLTEDSTLKLIDELAARDS